MTMGYLEGKAALVTGGGTGAGRAISLRLASEGADVAVNYSRSQKDSEDTVAEIEKLGGKAIAVQADVTDDASVRTMVDRAAGEFGRLDILVNNAGATHFVALDDLEGLTDEAWHVPMSVNVMGTFYCSRAAIPKMKANGGGQIVNTSSIAGLIGRGSSIAYCASKAAVNSLTMSLAISQAPDIRVNAVAPGIILTRWVDGKEEFVNDNLEQTPLRKVCEPEDVADAVYALIISDLVTGQVLTVDGGRSL
jgi:3-oxoacyl-[acyl-carrier protein] reductase